MNLYRKLFGQMMDEAPADGGAGSALADPAAAPAAAPADPAPADPAAAADDGAPAEPPAEKVIPETYELAVPENYVIDPDIAELFQSTSKDLKLSQEEATRVSDLGFKIIERQKEAAIAEVEKWRTDVENDPVLGGANLTANHAIAEVGVDAIASPELKQLLISTGMSNHPAVFKAFHKLGLMVKDDGFISGGSRTVETETTRAERMFGKKS